MPFVLAVVDEMVADMLEQQCLWTLRRSEQAELPSVLYYRSRSCEHMVSSVTSSGSEVKVENV